MATPFDDPTLQHLGVDPSTVDSVTPLEQARTWLAAFEASVSTGDPLSILPLFHEHGFWKDILALTWTMRTIKGHSSIQRLLDARLAATGLSAFHLLEDAIHGPKILRPLPDMVFIRLCFEFETKHGKGLSVAFLVPTSDGTWKAWSLLTRLGSLKAYPEKTGELRTRYSYYDSWEGQRRNEIEFDNTDPTVLIIGAGHSGLAVAARLANLGVSTLLIDKHGRVGDSWRTRYNSLRLHDPVWTNQLPYLSYPETWPVYCPASKMGDWLEAYATALDLNVWLGTTVTSSHFDQDTETWRVSIDRAGTTRTMTVKHLIFATGFGGGFPKMPDIPGKELYRGTVQHSVHYNSAKGYEGKKVIVVGAATSAHDIARDLLRHGCDVTMVQRSPIYVISQEAMEKSLKPTYNEHFPIEFADILGVAMPFATLKHLLRGSVADIANGIDKELLDGLTKAGFETCLGPDGGGLLTLTFERGGGLYVETGASRDIINGAIKVKKSRAIRKFTERGIELEDGVGLEGDLIVFATGFKDIPTSITQVCGAEVASKVGKVWGLDEEGELQGIWKKTGHPRLWIAMANFGRTRLHSLHLALQIKAIESGLVEGGVI